MKTVLLILSMRDMLIPQVSKGKPIAILKRAVYSGSINFNCQVFVFCFLFFSFVDVVCFCTNLAQFVCSFCVCLCVINCLLDMMVHTWKPSNTKVKAGELFRIQDQLGYIVSLWPVWATERDSLSKKKKKRSKQSNFSIPAPPVSGIEPKTSSMLDEHCLMSSRPAPALFDFYYI